MGGIDNKERALVIIDRRGHDPYAPAYRQAAPVAEYSAPAVALEDLNKADLVQRAAKCGLPTYGNKQDLIDRLRSIPGRY